MTLRVIEGGKKQGQFACTWCGGTFETRAKLDKHWKASAQCGRNKTVSDPSQARLNPFISEE